MTSFLRRTWAEIDLNALEHNYNEIRKATAPESEIMCVIKADAYGHGAVTTAHEFERLGANRFAVSNIEEALQLRENGITAPILILGFTPASAAEALAKNHIAQAVFSEEYAKELSACAVKQGVTVKIHIKLDTGMSRIGFMYQEPERDKNSISEIVRVCGLDGLEHEGIFTHFAVSDEGDEGKDYTLKQLDCFSKAIENLKSCGVEFALRHCSNSGAIIDYKQAHMNCVRAGIILYGLFPSSKLSDRLDLKPVMQIKSVIAQIKYVEPNTAVSYGGIYKTDKKTCIATVPIGYADGYTRSLGNSAKMLVGGQYVPVIGRVCMDQLMLDISGVENVKVGDEVTVIGTDGQNSITFEEIAALTGTINYEVICVVGKRVPRIYYKNGKKIGVMDCIYSGEAVLG